MRSFNCHFCKSNMDALYYTINCSNCPCFNVQLFVDSKISSIILFNRPYSVKLDFINNESRIYCMANYGTKNIYQVNSIMNVTPQNIKSKLPMLIALI